MKRLQRLLVLAALLALPMPVLAQSEALEDARAFSQIAKQHDAKWMRGFMEAFLGQNYAETHWRVAEKLQAIGKANNDVKMEKVLKGTGEAFVGVMELAAEEARTWKAGKPISSASIDLLAQLLGFERFPGRVKEFRVESLQIPQRYETWLYNEQFVNDKVNDERRFASLKNSEVPAELDPTRGNVFYLPYVEVPYEDIKTTRAPGSAETAEQVIVTKGGKKYVRFFIHPTAEEYYEKLINKYGVQRTFVATPTSSPRSMFVWDPYNPKAKPFIVKTSLPLEVAGGRRMVQQDKVERAVGNLAMIDEAIQRGQLPKGIVMAEQIGVMPKGFGGGMIVRDLPASMNKVSTEWLPGFSLVGHDGRETSKLVKMIRKSGMDPHTFVNEKIMKPMLTSYAKLTFGQGLVGEPHQQNTLFEVDRNGLPTGKVMFRDLDSFKVDVELRARLGLTLRPLTEAQRPTKIFKTAKGESYYIDSYKEYIQRDIGFMIDKELKRYYPSFDRDKLYTDMDKILAEQMKKHLKGVEIDTKTWRTWDPGKAVAEFKAQEVEASRQNLSMSQKSLKAEFERGVFNYRVMWVDKSLMKRVGTPQFLLHDGAVEMRMKGKTVGFTFLEPKNSQNFYRGVPYPRKKATSFRLKQLFKAFDRLGAKQRAEARFAPKVEVAETETARQKISTETVRNIFEATRVGALDRLLQRFSEATPAERTLLAPRDEVLRKASVEVVSSNSIFAEEVNGKTRISIGLLNAIEVQIEQMPKAEQSKSRMRVLGLIFGHELAHTSGINTDAERTADREALRILERSVIGVEGKPTPAEMLVALEAFNKPTGGKHVDSVFERLRNLLRYGTPAMRLKEMQKASEGKADPLASYRRVDGTLRWQKAIAEGALGTGKFAMALFLKELAIVARTGDRMRIEEFFEGLMGTDFYVQYGLFVAGAKIGDMAYVRYLQRYVKPGFVGGLLRTNMVLATGLALPLIVQGQFEAKPFAISLFSLGLSSIAVQTAIAKIRWVMTLKEARNNGTLGKLASMGKLARVGGWFYAAAELAVVLYIAEGLEHEINTQLERHAAKTALAEAGRAFLQASREGDAEAVRAAAEAYRQAWNDYRDFLYSPLDHAEDRLAMRLNKLSAEAKRQDDQRRATLERVMNYDTLRKNIEDRFGSVDAYADELLRESELELQKELGKILQSYDNERVELLEGVYTKGQRDGDYLRGGVDGLGDPSGNRLQAYQDEIEVLNAVSLELRGQGKDAEADAIDESAMWVRLQEDADTKLWQGKNVIEEYVAEEGLSELLEGAMSR